MEKRLLGGKDAFKKIVNHPSHYTKPPPSKMDVIPKTFRQIILVSK